MPRRFSSCLLIGVASLAMAGCQRLPDLQPLSWSPDGKTLATDWKGDLRLVDAGTGRQRILMTPARKVACPTYSPDGKMLAYIAASGAPGARVEMDLWLCHLESRAEVRIARNMLLPQPGQKPMTVEETLGTLRPSTPIPFTLLAWRSDSRALAFPIQTTITDMRVGVYHLPTRRTVLFGERNSVSFGTVWAQTGKRLAFVTVRPDRQGVFNLHYWDGQAATAKPIRQDDSPDPARGIPLRWSADGKSLVMRALGGVRNSQQWRLDLHGHAEPLQASAMARSFLSPGLVSAMNALTGKPMAGVAVGDSISTDATIDKVLGSIPHDTGARAVALSPDGQLLAVAPAEPKDGGGTDAIVCKVTVLGLGGARRMAVELTDDVPRELLTERDLGWLRYRLAADSFPGWQGTPTGGRALLGLAFVVTLLAVLSRIGIRALAQVRARR